MYTPRTVIWLAILAAVVPFLAIPEWLMRLLVAALAAGIALVGYQLYTQGADAGSANSSQNLPQSPFNPQLDRPASTQDDENTNSQDSDEESDADNDNGPVDIEDSDADRMVAENRWRRRASRNLADRGSET